MIGWSIHRSNSCMNMTIMRAYSLSKSVFNIVQCFAKLRLTQNARIFQAEDLQRQILFSSAGLQVWSLEKAKIGK